MKKLRFNVILLFILTIIILYFVLKNDFSGIVSVLLSANIWYVLLAILIIFLSDLLKGISLNLIIKEANKEQKMVNSLSLTMKTNFFNGITPFCLGGQPFQLYLLKKKDNIDYATGANILFKDFYTYQLALMILSILFLIINDIFNIVTFGPIIKNAMALGFLVNLVVTALLIYVPYTKGNGKNFVSKVIRLLNKFNIIKDEDNAIRKYDDSMTKFKSQVSEIILNPKLVVTCIVLNAFKIIFYAGITGICFMATNIMDISIANALVITVLIIMMSSFVPIPGASGGMEFGFAALFGSLVIGPELGATMLLWRFVSYYLPMIFGAALFFVEKRN